jgi:RimJ/RimL family protein N-acetyltransferase
MSTETRLSELAAQAAEAHIGGDGIHLRGLRESDLDGGWYRWFNDPEVTYYENKGYVENTRELQAEYYRGIQGSDTDVILAITDTETGLHIGNVGLHNIEKIHQTAMLGIVIGEKAFWGKGYGRQAWRLITGYGFEQLGLRKITATVFAGNDRSLACALAAGYVIEGTQKAQMAKHGRRFDLTLVGITREMWNAR